MAKKLDDKLIQQLADIWGLTPAAAFIDEEVAEAAGLTLPQLRGYLRRNAGLRSLRAGARARLKVHYLRRLLVIIDKAEKAKDYATAAKYLTWLLEKQFPKEFGSISQVELNDGDGPKLIKLPFAIKALADRQESAPL